MPRLSPTELASRKTGLGSTDIVEICGLAPWAGTGPMRVYCEKLGLLPPDDAEPEDSDHLDWGHRQEPVIAQWYEDTQRCRLQLGGPVRSIEYPILWATLDRTVIGQSILVECKNVGSPHFYRHWNTSDPDGVPNYVRAQVTIAMAFYGASRCDVVASIGGRPPHVWTVWPNAELAETMIERAITFWRDHVQAQVPPRLDHTESSRLWLTARYPGNSEPSMLDASPDVDDLGRLRKVLSARSKADEKEITRLDNEILLRVGHCDGVVGDGWKMTWKTGRYNVRRARFTSGKEEAE
jgi:putative phage-type endonuclease